jgi:hypothetical protein
MKANNDRGIIRLHIKGDQLPEKKEGNSLNVPTLGWDKLVSDGI